MEKPSKKLLDKEIKECQSYTLKRIELSDHTHYDVDIYPKKYEPKEVEVKNQEEIKSSLKEINSSLSTFIKVSQSNFDNITNEINGINKRLDEHIQEFKEFKQEMTEFKSDMLEFKSQMLSLPTIQKELKAK